MPSEASGPANMHSADKGLPETGQRPPITGGVRGLLGLPMRASGVLSTAPLTTPPRGYHYGQPPLPASEEHDEGGRDVAQDDDWIEAGGGAGMDTPERQPRALPPYETGAQSDFPRSLRRHGASYPRAIPEHPADTRTTTTHMPAAQREQTNLVIPGISTQRTVFAALSHASDTTQVTHQPEALQPGPDKVVPLHAPVSLPHPGETALSRLAPLVTEDAKARPSSEAQWPSLVSCAPSPVEQMGVPNGEQGHTDVARRLTQLQRTVSDLAATVAAQASRMRDELQAQRHERKTPQRLVVVQRGDAASTTPPAFWERSRLGRSYLRTGR
jgi:hypothetical protein